MSKMSNIAQQVEALEMQNQELAKALMWSMLQLKEIDHDCHAGPDSGCRWCFEFWDYARLIGWDCAEQDLDDET